MALPSQFSDPFFKVASTAPVLKHGSEKGDQNLIDAAPITDTTGNSLPITGQGTIAALTAASGLLSFQISTELPSAPTLHLDIASGEVKLYHTTSSTSSEFKPTFLKGEEACYLRSGDITAYWLSLDKNNGIIRYGKYYTNKSMTLLECVLKHKDEVEGYLVWNGPQKDSWLEKLKQVSVDADSGKAPVQTVLQPLPVVIDRPPFVLTSDKITLQELENNQYTVPVNLPAACQTLYGNVGGPGITLDDPEDPEFPFADAIEYSRMTPGCWAYEKLLKKAAEFGKANLEMTYLRITLGYNQGNSPGIPYVLEIWPPGHFSPIHDHGDACAVIKVLHGEIVATYFDNLDKPIEIGKALCQKDGITWLGEENYQVHQLHNKTKHVCCTIQCYQYSDTNNTHEDVFNYTSADGTVVAWSPNSDMAFTDFRNKMKEEWKQHVGTNGT